MITKYKASWIASVERLTVESETKNKVTIGFDRLLGKTISYNKRSQGDAYCDTFDEAKQFLVDKHAVAIKELEGALRLTRENFRRAQALTEADVKVLR